MASFRLKFRAAATADKEGALYFQVIHERRIRQIKTGYRLFPSEWDERQSTIRTPLPANGRRRYLILLRDHLMEDTSRLQRILSTLENSSRRYTADRAVELFALASNHNGFVWFARELIRQLRRTGKASTAATYLTTLNSFMRFLAPREEVSLDDISSDLMMEYENYLRQHNICPNTSSFYMRNLRAIYNRAVDKELTVQRHPFKRVYTGIDKTVKRAVPLRIIRQIKRMELSQSPRVEYARDMFLFSFYTRGMSFVDMAYLKKQNLHNGVLSYRRRKTNQQLFIKWEKPMQEIVDKYDTTGTPYLLPIIRKPGEDEWTQYRTAAHYINLKLKFLSREIRLLVPITMYVARHAWASIAKEKHIAVSVISEAMGHESEKTTRIYLTALDTAPVDRANSLILRSL